jgi:glycoprotein endo-alpha-1,2-mannosidase
MNANEGLPGRSKISSSTKIFVVIAIVGALVIPMLHFIPAVSNLSAPLYPKRVCAFYYTWYGNTTVYYGEDPGTASHLLHWDESHPDLHPPIIHNPVANISDIAAAQHPTLNTSGICLFDSCDPQAIKYHISLAADAGINTFICTWWGINSYVDYTFRQVLNQTAMYNALHPEHAMQQTIYFETVQNGFNKSKPFGFDNLYNNLTFIIQNYGNHPAFLRIGDRPVIFIYATTSTQTPENWSRIVDKLHCNGMNPFLIVDVGVDDVRSDFIPIFDGFHTYNPLGLYTSEPQNALRQFEKLVLSSRSNGKLACATVLPGYDDTQVRHGTPVLKRNSGVTYRDSWNVAIKSRADWVLICTFNEWHEGTNIEPSVENSTYYMAATKNFTQLFTA